MAAFAGHAAVANASTCFPEPNCTQSVVVTQAQGTINETPTLSTVKWQGELYAFGETSDPQLCLPGPSDPSNSLCDHFQLTTQDPGPVRVVIQWTDSLNTFFLLVCINGVIDTSPGNHCTGGTEVAEDFNQSAQNFSQATWNASPGVTYEVRVIPFSVFGSDYTGCAAYTNFNGCPNPSTTTGGVVESSTCLSQTTSTTGDLITATSADRRITGGGDIADSSGNLKEHFSVNAAHKSSDKKPFQGNVGYKNDGVLQFKSTSIICASFFDEGTDPSTGKPKGSAEIRGQGRLKLSDGTVIEPECFRAFARDAGDPGAGVDQFDIQFTAPSTTTNSCTFSGAPAGRTIAKGSVVYHLST